MSYPEFKWQSKPSFIIDQWSVGVMIIEIFIGSRIILTSTSYEIMERLLDDCKEYMDGLMFELLSHLLFSEDNIILDSFKKDSAEYTSSSHLLNMRRFQKARVQDRNLTKRTNIFRQQVQLDGKHFFNRYELKRVAVTGGK